MRLIKSLVAACLLMTPLAPLHAQDSSALFQLTTLDDTKAWQGVGRLNIGTIGFCTGTLIAPDLVLTAAHCLFDLRTGERAEDNEIQFLAGWRDGRASAYRGVRQSVIHQSYEFRGRTDPERIGADIALLQLDQPIRHPSIRPFEAGQTAPRGQELKVVSYARDRANAPSLQETCHVLEKEADLYVTSCDVDFGASGAPVFVVEKGVAKVMSVVSAKAEWKEQKVALAVGVEDHLNEMKLVLGSRLNNASPAARAPQKKLIFSSGLQPSGARFLKP